MTNVACENCSWTGTDDDVLEIKKLSMRVAPGEIMPYGECPECEAVCHEAPFVDDSTRSIKVRVERTSYREHTFEVKVPKDASDDDIRAKAMNMASDFAYNVSAVEHHNEYKITQFGGVDE